MRPPAVVLTERIGATLLAALLLAGCSPASSDDPLRAEYEALTDQNEAIQDQLARIVHCLDEEGFPDVVIGDDHNIAARIAPEQSAEFDRAWATCIDRECPACGVAPDREQLTRLYRLEQQAALCLERNGFPVSAPPSLQAYLGQAGAERWSPHREAIPAMIAAGRLAEVRDACPDPGDYVSYWGP